MKKNYRTKKVDHKTLRIARFKFNQTLLSMYTFKMNYTINYTFCYITAYLVIYICDVYLVIC